MMKIHRFIGKFDFITGNLEIKDSELVNQIKNVLCLEPGEKIILSNGNLQEALAQIVEVKKNSVEIFVLKFGQSSAEPTVETILYLSILKKENFDWAVQKAVEAGVAKIVPLIARHTVKLNVNSKRLEKIIKEAAEQSGRGHLPVLLPPMDFLRAVKEAKTNDLNLFFEQTGEALEKSFAGIKPARVGIFIGPEGGWDQSETRLAEESGLKLVSLGQLTLRAETAAIVATYLMTRV